MAEFDGVNSSEHGDGRVRSAFNRAHLRRRPVRGDAPHEGAVRPARPPQPRRDGRRGADHRRPARPGAARRPAPLAHAAGVRRDGGMRAAADRCQRIGACRKTGIGVMCPSYMATREEEHATRGRANALVKALSSARPEGRAGRRAPARDPRPLPRVQGVQERVPAERRHGVAEGRVPLALPGRPRRAAALADVRLDPRG